MYGLLGLRCWKIKRSLLARQNFEENTLNILYHAVDAIKWATTGGMQNKAMWAKATSEYILNILTEFGEHCFAASSASYFLLVHWISDWILS